MVVFSVNYGAQVKKKSMWVIGWNGVWNGSLEGKTKNCYGENCHKFLVTKEKAIQEFRETFSDASETFSEILVNYVDKYYDNAGLSQLLQVCFLSLDLFP
jgi:hypothetical protein